MTGERRPRKKPKPLPIDVRGIIAEVGATLVSSLVLEDVLATVARQVGEALGVGTVDIQDYSAERDELTYEAFWSRERATDEELAYVGTVINLADRPDFKRIVEGREPVEWHIDDPELPAEERELMVKWNELTTLDAPLIYGDEVIGTIGVTETHVRHYSAEERELFAQLCVLASIAIHNAKMFRRQEEQNRHLTSLLDSSRAITSTIVLEEVLDLIAQKAAEAVAVPRCMIYEFAPEDDALMLHSTFFGDGTTDYAADKVRPLREHESDRAILLGGKIVVEQASDETIDQALRDEFALLGETTFLNVPIVFKGEPLGLMVLAETERERHFIGDELDLATGIAEQAAAALQNARLFRRQEEQNGRLVALLETSRTIAASLDLAELRTRLKIEVGLIFGESEDAITIRLRNPGGRWLLVDEWLDDPFGAAGEHDGGGKGDGLDPLARRALAALAPRQDETPEGPRLVVPLVSRDEAVGFLAIASARLRPYDETDVELLQIIANQAAVAVENTRLYQTIKHQAVTDGLTSLFNHRFFYEHLAGEVQRARRYRAPLTLLMIDIDDFKRFNDSHGHPVGDAALRQIAGILGRRLRRGADMVARYGGEEFAVILPSTPRDPGSPDAGAAAAGDGADVVAERIRADVEAAGLADAEGQPLTVSIGVARSLRGELSVDELVASADKALYLAKRLGKNRVETFR